MPDAPTVLLTGFEPFGGSDDNPSLRAVERVAAEDFGGIDLRTGILPVTWAGAWPVLASLIEAHQPDLVVACGQSHRRKGVTVERFALNFAEGRIPDNDGAELPASELVEGGPLAYASTLPVDVCVAAIQQLGVPAQGSHTAGAFTCNCVLYRTLHLASTEDRPLRAGFVHLPMLPGQLGDPEQPRLELEASARAVRAVLEASLAAYSATM
ncbi:MAG: pyroglutamyl-peptidase I [Planctomycetota bacterium]